MNRYLSLIALAVFLGSCGRADLTVVQVDPMLKIMPEAAAFLPSADTVDCVVGGHADFQVAFRSSASIEGLSLECRGFDGAEVVRTGLVGLVGVEQMADNQGYDVIRSASGMYPDPILTGGPWDIPSAQASCARLTVKGLSPGVFNGALVLSGKAGGRRFSKEVPLVLKVWNIELEKPSLYTINWNFDFDECLSKWNGGEVPDRESADYREYMEDMADALAEMHQNVTMVPVFGLVDMKKDSLGWHFDFNAFNRTVRFYEERGLLDRLQCGELGHRREPYWTAGLGLFVPDGKGEKEIYPVDNKLVKEFYSAFLPAFAENLRSNGWWEKTWQKVCDEPIDANADDYRAIITFLRSIEPSLKVMEAVQTTKLTGVMDVWVPQLNTWHVDYDFFRSRAEAGDEVWFYTCCYPRGEYPNRFIEQPLLKVRMLYWLAYKYGAAGYLHWGFNYWTGDPFRTADRPGTGTVLPGGDAWIVYPGYHRFERSVRFDAARDGIEDHTLLTMLARKNPAAAKSLCDRMVFNWWVSCSAPSEFAAARRELLEALAE